MCADKPEQYEYTTLWYKDEYILSTKLTSMGEEGWILCATIVQNGSTIKFIFMRQKKPSA